jgi:hypothetical protein
MWAGEGTWFESPGLIHYERMKAGKFLFFLVSTLNIIIWRKA